MKKVLFLMFLLFLIVSGTANLKAQVTIGSEQNPQGGAVLDLSQVNDQKLGFLLPRVSLVNVTDWQLRGNSTNGVGMLVYNTNPDTAGGNGKAGVYIWTGAGGWEALKSNFIDAVLVEGFDLSPSSAVDLYVGQTATFAVSDFMPYNATYQGVSWTISEGADNTSITSRSMTTCSLIGLAPGQSTLTVMSRDENYQQTVTITVNTSACPSGYIIAGGAYILMGMPDLPAAGTSLAQLTRYGYYATAGDLCLASNDLGNGGSGQSFTSASSGCQSLVEGGFADWRLPDILELGHLEDSYASYGLLAPTYWSDNWDGPQRGVWAWVYASSDYQSFAKSVASHEAENMYVRCVRSL